MSNLVKRFIAEEDGLELLEYAILGVVLVAGLLVAYGQLASSISNGLSTAAGGLSQTGGGGN